MLVDIKKDINPGDKITVTKDISIQFICESINGFNRTFGKIRAIKNLFAKWGPDHNQTNIEEFLTHLENLTEIYMYNALTK